MPHAADVRSYGGSAGRVSVAPAGTALPVLATTSLNAAFEELGFIDENGITQTQDTTQTDIKAWQGAAIVRTIRTEHKLSYKFAALETNAVVLEQFYNQVNYDGIVEITGDQASIKPWVIDAVDGTDLVRIVIPFGQVGEIGDTVYQSGDAAKYEFTVVAYPDTSSVKAYMYFSGPDS